MLKEHNNPESKVKIMFALLLNEVTFFEIRVFS